MDALSKLVVNMESVGLDDLCSMHSYFNKIDRELKSEQIKEIITTLETKILETIRALNTTKDTK